MITFERINNLLRKINNDELLLLKGHLLIEEVMTRSLELQYGADNVRMLDLTFYKKTILIAAILKYSKNDDIIGIILKINTLRNKLAHQIDFDLKREFKQVIIDFYGITPKTLNNKKTYLNGIKKIFYYTTARLAGTIEGYEKSK